MNMKCSANALATVSARLWTGPYNKRDRITRVPRAPGISPLGRRSSGISISFVVRLLVVSQADIWRVRIVGVRHELDQHAGQICVEIEPEILDDVRRDDEF